MSSAKKFKLIDDLWIYSKSQLVQTGNLVLYARKWQQIPLRLPVIQKEKTLEKVIIHLPKYSQIWRIRMVI